jgi:hypothetical protein
MKPLKLSATRRKPEEIDIILSCGNMQRWIAAGRTRADIHHITGLSRKAISEFIDRNGYDVPYHKQWKSRLDSGKELPP